MVLGLAAFSVLLGACNQLGAQGGPPPASGSQQGAAPAGSTGPTTTQPPASTPPPTSSSPPPTASTPPNAGGLVGGAGFCEGSSILWDSDADLARHLDGIAATGARWLRIDIRWPDAEPSQGALNWRSVDRVVDAASARGLDVLGILDYTPAWARPAGTSEKAPPTNPADYGRFATAAAQHFGAKVKAYEIWNEPNSPGFWEGGANPAAYTALLVAGYDAIKAVNPSATVLTGGTAPGATGGGWLAPVDFLQGVYAAGGGGHFDAVSHHGYHWPYMPLGPESNWNWNSFGGVTPQLHNVMVANGDGAKRIWITESGSPVPTTKNGITTTPDYLAAYVKEAFAAMRSWSWSGPLFLYSYRDRGTNPANPEDVFGLVTRDYTPKGPALDAFKAAVRG